MKTAKKERREFYVDGGQSDNRTPAQQKDEKKDKFPNLHCAKWAVNEASQTLYCFRIEI